MPAKKPAANAPAAPVRRGRTAAAKPDAEAPEAPAKRKNGRSTIADGIVFEAPPQMSGRGRKADPRWNELLAALQANPGEWAVVGTFNTATNRPAVLRDGGCKFTVRRIEEEDEEGNEVTRFKMWAMWSEEDEEGE